MGSKLIELRDLRGAFHNHTLASDGNATIEEMRDAAIRLGLTYISINDHSQSASYVNGLTPQQLSEQINRIFLLNQDNKGQQCYLFTGTESDILADGSLDFDFNTLNTLDIVIASIHNRFQNDKNAMTHRLVQAALNPQTCMIGHPTGRSLYTRQSAEFDIEKLLDACETSGCVLEINASTQRFDLNATHAAMAKERGIMLAINADAHSPEGLEDLAYGITIAQQAGLTPDGVLNCLELKDMQNWLLHKKSQ